MDEAHEYEYVLRFRAGGDPIDREQANELSSSVIGAVTEYLTEFGPVTIIDQHLDRDISNAPRPPNRAERRKAERQR